MAGYDGKGGHQAESMRGNGEHRAGDVRGNGGRRGDGARGKDRRAARAQAAAAHIEDMERRFAKEIEASVAGMLRFDGMPRRAAASERATAAADAEKTATADDRAASVEMASVEAEAVPASRTAELTAADEDATADAAAAADAAPGTPLPTVSVVDEDAVAAILARGRGRAQFCDLAVLDFASFTNPGGGYERGAMAQEEALCAESFLYNVLARAKDWYGENRRRNINCNLYRNRALVAPRVRFAREKVHAYADVIVAAAPNAARARTEYGVDEAALARALRDRVRFALAVADELGHEKLILGAWGCGVFGWEAEAVAEAFRAELATGTHAVREAIFAIPRVRYNDNHERFAHALACFPERNGVPFEQARAERAARDAAAEAAAAEGEGEEDWRQYL